MEIKPISFFFLLVLPIFYHGARSTTFTFKNNCMYPVWPGTLTGSGTPLTTTGFELPIGSTNVISATAPWSGRMWARSGCTNSNGKFTCASGDCGSGQLGCNGAGATPPASLVEFFLAPNNGQDFFDISLVDGFNLAVSIVPQGGSGNCSSVGCPKDINQVCPQELKANVNGAVVGCKSACDAFNQPQYCCSGSFNTPQTCPPTNYSQIFKAQCPQAYSYAYDDKTSTFTCTGGANYLVTFCPGS